MYRTTNYTSRLAFKNIKFLEQIVELFYKDHSDYLTYT